MTAVLLGERVPVWGPRWSPVQQLIRSLYAASRMDRGVDAGALLVAGGWAVFPVPVAHDPVQCSACNWAYRNRGTRCEGKSDQGPGALSYRDATRDESEWWAMCRDSWARHHVADFNIAVSPWACSVPMIGIDLDGPAAVEGFREEHGGLDKWFRVLSSGKGGGVHMYVASDKPVTGTNPWGGEYRADRGHLMLPPSLIDGRRDYYRPAGLVLTSLGLKVARGGKVSTGVPAARAVNRDDMMKVVTRLSLCTPSEGAKRRLFMHLDLIGAAGHGERYPSMRAAVASAVALARVDALPLNWAIACITDSYSAAVTDEARDPASQVLEMVAWTLGQEFA